MSENPIVPSLVQRPRQLRARRLFRSPGLTALGAASALCFSALGAAPALAALTDVDAIVETTDDVAPGTLSLVWTTDASVDVDGPTAAGEP